MNEIVTGLRAGNACPKIYGTDVMVTPTAEVKVSEFTARLFIENYSYVSTFQFWCSQCTEWLFYHCGVTITGMFPWARIVLDIDHTVWLLRLLLLMG